MPRWIRRAVAVETGRSGLVVLLAAYLVLVVTVAGLIHQYRAGERDALRGRVDTRVAASAELVGDFVAEFRTHEAELAADRLTGDVDPAWFRSFIRDLGYDGAVVLDDHGRVLVSAPADAPPPGAPLAERYAHLREALDGYPSASDVVTAANPQVRIVAFSVPFPSPTGRRVLSVTYRPGDTPVSPFLKSVSSLPSHRAYLVDAHGALVERNGETDPARGTLATADPDLAAALAEESAGRTELAGRPSYYVAAPVEGTPWRLVFSAPDAELFAPLSGPGQWVPWIVLAAFAITGLLALNIAGRYRGAARRLADNQSRTRSILVGTPDAFIGVDDTGRITDWNPAAEELVGWPAAEVIGRPAHEVYIPGHLRERYERGIAALAAGELDLPSGATEFELLHRDGHLVPIELVVSVIRWGKKGRRMHAFIRDMTPRRRAETQLRTLAGIVAATGDAVLSKTLDGTITTWNPAAERLYGWPADEIVGRGVELLVPEDRKHELQALMSSVSAGIAVPAFETLRLRKDGTTVEVSINVSPLVDADGTVVGACASARDITETHRQAAELKEAEERFRLAFDAVPVGMVLSSLAAADRGRILRVNDGFTWMLGYTEEELLQRSFADITHPDDVAAESELLAPFMAGKQRTIRFEKRYLRGDGSTVWAMVSSAVVEGPDGRPRYAVTQVEDITARRAEQERLQALALADPLTGLANRLLFEDRLAQAVHRAGRHERAIAIVYCDLDQFKPVNDQFGHPVGDELLKQVGHRLLVAMRPSDTVARLGGDEFAVICEDLPNPDAAVTIADRVRTTVEGTYLVSAGAVRIGCSVGVATASGPHIEPRELVARADLSMFSDKRSRRRKEAAGGAPAPASPATPPVPPVSPAQSPGRDAEPSQHAGPPSS